jgi:tRNA threonylcarbamoyladenosine biosynthesis protein TsaE
MKIIIESSSAARTKAIGRKIGAFLEPGDVVALSGELGAGKTTLVKGLAKGLGLKNEADVSSPTFTLVNEYPGRAKIYHMDWYRLENPEGDDEELISECLSGDGVSLIEWPEKARKLLPRRRLSIGLKHVSPKKRRLEIRSSHPRHALWMKKLK